MKSDNRIKFWCFGKSTKIAVKNSYQYRANISAGLTFKSVYASRLPLRQQREQMKVCGVYKLSVFFTNLFVVLVLSSLYGGVNTLSVVRSTTSNGRGDVDTFSNPSASCSPAGCVQVVGASGCKVGDCCICKCGQKTPNYLIHARSCVANEEVEDGKEPYYLSTLFYINKNHSYKNVEAKKGLKLENRLRTYIMLKFSK